MAMVFQILKKDVYRLRMWIFVWFVFLGLQMVLGLKATHLSIHNLYFQLSLPMIFGVVGISQILLMAIIISFLIHEDALVGTTSFWMSRPIARSSLFMSKFTFVCLVLILPSLIMEMIVLAANHFSFQLLLLGVPEILLEKLILIVPLMVLASVTIRLSQYTFIGISFLFVYVLLMPGMVHSSIFLPIFRTHSFTHYVDITTFHFYSLRLSSQLIAQILFLILSMIVLIHQFLTRRTKRTFCFIVIAFVMANGVGYQWKIDFLKENSSKQVQEVVDPVIKVSLDLNHVFIDNMPRAGAKAKKIKVIQVKQDVKGLSDKYLTFLKETKNARMIYDDGFTLTSETMGARISKDSYGDYRIMKSLQIVLKDYELMNPFEKEFSYSHIFQLPEQTFNLHKGKIGRFEARLIYDIYEYQLDVALSAKAFQRYSNNSEDLAILDVNKRQDGVTIFVVEKNSNFLFDRSKPYVSQGYHDMLSANSFEQVYLLRNKRLKQAYLAEISNDRIVLNQNVMRSHSQRMTQKIKPLDFLHINERNEDMPVIDEDWLKDAELIRLRAKKVGSVEKDVSYSRFYLPAQSSELKARGK